MDLRICRDGYGLDLLIAEIRRDQLIRLEKACTFLGRFYWKRSLQNTWYLNEIKMKEIFGVGSFRQMKTGNHRYLDPGSSNRASGYLPGLLTHPVRFTFSFQDRCASGP